LQAASTEFGSYKGNNRPRLYNNDGRGNFLINTEALPPGIDEMAAVIAVEDFDGDGDMDLFIGGECCRKNTRSRHAVTCCKQSWKV
jgi:hypothetical protein